MLQLRGGDEPEPLTRWLEKALGRGGTQQLDMEQARRRLENHGMKICAAKAPAETWQAVGPARARRRR
jgi:hypothetical protein